MKIIKFKGGLGNQIFQYVFLKYIQKKENIEDIYADFSYYQNGISQIDIFKLNIDLNIAPIELLKEAKFFPKDSKRFYKFRILLESIFNRKYYFEWGRKTKDYNKIKNYVYFDGYWQSYKYLEEVEDKIKPDLILKKDLPEEILCKINLLKSQQSVFIGVRRGDYLTSYRNRRKFGTFGNEYYNKAIEIIKENVKDPVFYVFSNDIKWVKRNMKFNCDYNILDLDDVTDDIIEFFLISSCKHAVIVNSTYYWWAARLIDNPNKIIVAPDQWFADGTKIDIVPKNWIRINN